MAIVEPYQPTNVLKPVAENIWIVDGPIIHMQQFGLNVPFPTRMTIIRLANGELFVHSPVKATETLYSAIQELGSVAHLVSPNKIHYASIGVWAKRFPKAKCWAAPGVRERAEQHKIAISFSDDLGETAEQDWSSDIDQLVFHGSRFMDEIVFFHKSSRTLILADLIENFEREKVSPWLAWLLKLAGNLDPDGKLPIDLRMTFYGRHKQACESFKKMINWAPEKVILAHGRWYEKDGVKELNRAFSWLKCSKN